MREQLRRHHEEGGRSWSNSEFRSGYSGTPTHPSILPSLPQLREARGSVRACCLPSSFLRPVLVRVPSLVVGGRGGQRQRCQHEECVCTRPRPSFVHRARPVASPFPLLPPPCCLRLVPRRVRPSRYPAPALRHRAGVGFTNGETSHSRARMACLECCGRTQEMSPDYVCLVCRCCNI